MVWGEAGVRGRLLRSDKSPEIKSAEKRVGVLRLRHTIRKRIVWLRSG